LAQLVLQIQLVLILLLVLEIQWHLVDLVDHLDLVGLVLHQALELQRCQDYPACLEILGHHLVQLVLGFLSRQDFQIPRPDP